MSGSDGLDNVLRKKNFRLKLDVHAQFLKLASQLYTPLNKLQASSSVIITIWTLTLIMTIILLVFST